MVSDDTLTVEQALADRGGKYGAFRDNASLALWVFYEFKRYDEKSSCCLDDTSTMALLLIQHKLARLCCGDARHRDSWLDIAGYAQLVVEHLDDQEGRGAPKPPPPPELS